MEITTLLVLGADSPERDRLTRALLGVFGSLRVFEADDAREALVLLNEMLIDAVVAVGAADDGAWASFIRRWMAGKPGLREIPFLVASGAEDCRALKRLLDARLAAVWNAVC